MEPKTFSFKSFFFGVVCTALAASIAFNFYQAGQLKNSVYVPSNMAALELPTAKKGK